MRARSKTLIVAAVAAVAIGGLPSAAAVPPTAAPSGEAVTLLTGDRVLLARDGSVTDIRPGPGRERIAFHTFRRDGSTHVVPADALRLLATDRLDPRLFDVTLLRDSHYGDTIPLLVGGQVRDTGLTVSRRLPGYSVVLADGDGSDWRSVASAREVWLDGRRRASLDHSVPRIGAPAAWATGVTGAGVTVAVLDTGVDQTHPDLAGREVAEANFTESPDNLDRYGHGTHVASTVAGGGERYRGVAPDARLLDGKVLGDDGWGTDSAIIAGMHWAAEHGARIVNLSLGSTDVPGVDPLEETVNRLSAERGMLFVVAVGNAYRPRTIGSPASAEAALAVSAIDRDGAVPVFASRGPGLDSAVKPEITAPGVDITAALPGGEHGPLSGTSMAAPHVSGAAALLAQRNPHWTGARLRSALTGSAVPTSDAPVFEQGAGRVDVPRALASTVYASPPALDFGVRRYPHEGPATKTLTYHNDGATGVTLDLALDTTGFTVSTERVTVPAGGSAAVEVTAAQDVGSDTSATITASAGALSVRTPVGVVWEPESYDLTIDVIGRDGRPATDYDALRMGFGEDGFHPLYDPDGTITTRVPAGRTPIEATMYDREAGRHYLVSAPSLTVTRDTRITLDARTARPVDITLPEDVSSDGFDVGVAVYRPDGLANFHSIMYGSPADVLVAHAGPVLSGDNVTTWLSGQWGDGRYHAAWFTRGRSQTGFTRTVHRRDLAEVTLRLVAPAPGAHGTLLMRPSPVGGFNRAFHGGASQAAPVELPALPAERVVYVNAEAEWTTELSQSTPGGGQAEVTTPERRYLAGREYRQVLGHPVLGPALPPTRYPYPGAVRTGDWISTALPLFGDAAGNAGSSSFDSGHSALYRDGSLVGELPWPGGGYFEVPPQAGTYRLTTSATRSGFALSTRIDAAWTFRSAHAPDTGWTRVPLSTVRFLPPVSEDGTAPGGRFAVPVVVTGPSGEPVRPRRLSVEVSYDDGTSWRAVPVTGGGVARLDHPSGAESVSLRARAVNRDGTAAEVTIVRAYLVRD